MKISVMSRMMGRIITITVALFAMVWGLFAQQHICSTSACLVNYPYSFFSSECDQQLPQYFPDPQTNYEQVSMSTVTDGAQTWTENWYGFNSAGQLIYSETSNENFSSMYAMANLSYTWVCAGTHSMSHSELGYWGVNISSTCPGTTGRLLAHGYMYETTGERVQTNISVTRDHNNETTHAVYPGQTTRPHRCPVPNSVYYDSIFLAP